MATTPKQSGFFIQSNFGSRGNFELVVPNPSGGMSHYWRDNDAASRDWYGPFNFGGSESVNGVALIQSNFDRHLEVVATIGRRFVRTSRLVHYFRESNPPYTWRGPAEFGTPVALNTIPTLIQSSFGERGNFEVVVVRPNRGLSHYWRENHESGLPWHGPNDFATDHHFTGVSLIQSNFGPGNLELVASTSDLQLVHYWRENHRPWTWYGPTVVRGSESTLSNPSLIQSSFGSQGNFELVAPKRSGGLAHFHRDNDAPDLPWNGPANFGERSILMLSLIQSNFGLGADGDLEVVVVTPEKFHYRRDEAGTWHGPSHF